MIEDAFLTQLYEQEPTAIELTDDEAAALVVLIHDTATTVKPAGVDDRITLYNETVHQMTDQLMLAMLRAQFPKFCAAVHEHTVKEWWYS